MNTYRVILLMAGFAPFLTASAAPAKKSFRERFKRFFQSSCKKKAMNEIATLENNIAEVENEIAILNNNITEEEIKNNAVYGDKKVEKAIQNQNVIKEIPEDQKQKLRKAFDKNERLLKKLKVKEEIFEALGKKLEEQRRSPLAGNLPKENEMVRNSRKTEEEAVVALFEELGWEIPQSLEMFQKLLQEKCSDAPDEYDTASAVCRLFGYAVAFGEKSHDVREQMSQILKNPEILGKNSLPLSPKEAIDVFNSFQSFYGERTDIPRLIALLRWSLRMFGKLPQKMLL